MKARSVRIVLPAIVAVAVVFLAVGGAANAAGEGTFSGAITPTACGPMHDVQVVAGDTTIDAVAAEYVSANDITLDLYSSGIQSPASTWPPDCTYSRNSRSVTRAPYRTVVRLRL